MATGERLLGLLNELTEAELPVFVFHLSGRGIPRGKLSGATRVQLAELLMQFHPGQALDVAAEALAKIPKWDLLEERLPRRGPEERPPDAAAAAAAAAGGQSHHVSEQELMKLARNMGRKWRQIGIEFLGVETTRLEQIEEENATNVVMRAFYMLLDWRNREGRTATTAKLYHLLNQEGVDLDQNVYAFLLERA